MRVLIVDKEPDDRSALANDLAERTDMEAFDSAENILEALDKLQTEEYDAFMVFIGTPSRPRPLVHWADGFVGIHRL